MLDEKEANIFAGRAAGVIEAKKAGITLIGVETQSDKYTKGLPDGLPAWSTPLPFCHESTEDETRFTNNLDPEPRSRQIFAFHKPDYIFSDARFNFFGFEVELWKIGDSPLAPLQSLILFQNLMIGLKL